MSCPNCGEELGSNPERCSKCKAERLLRSGRARALKTAGLPLMVAVLLGLGVILYAILSQPSTPQTQQITPRSQRVATEKTRVPQDVTKVSGKGEFPIIVSTSISGTVRDNATVTKVVEAEAYFVEAEHLLLLKLFKESPSTMRPSFFALLELSLQVNENEDCSEIESARLRLRDYNSIRTVELGDLVRVSPEFRCKLQNYADNKLKLDIALATGASSDVGVDLRYKGAVVSKEAYEFVELVQPALYQLAVWDIRSGRIEIGFFDSVPSVEDLQTIQSRQSLRHSTKIRPNFVLQLTTFDEVRELTAASLKSYELFLFDSSEQATKMNDGEKIAFVTIAKDSEGFSLFSNQLEQGALLRLHAKEVSEQASSVFSLYAWDLLVAAPIMDLRKTSSATLASKIVAVTSERPSTTGGKVETDSSSVVIKDAVVLKYNSSNRYSVGLYDAIVDTADREKIRSAKSVWSARTSNKPIAVLALALTKEQEVSSLELTYLRRFLGDFYFEGERDRITFAYKDSEIDPSNVLFLDVGDDELALHFRDQVRSDASKDNFYWNILLKAKPIVVN